MFSIPPSITFKARLAVFVSCCLNSVVKVLFLFLGFCNCPSGVPSVLLKISVLNKRAITRLENTWFPLF